jgi:hypothetical protein
MLPRCDTLRCLGVSGYEGPVILAEKEPVGRKPATVRLSILLAYYDC